MSNTKVEPQPEQKLTINSYLRKKVTNSSQNDKEAEIKQKYTEDKPTNFKEYANKIKEKYAKPVEPSIDTKVADIKEKFHQEEQDKADRPAKINTKLANNEQES